MVLQWPSEHQLAMTTPDERAAIRAFLLTLEGKNGLQIADAIEDYLAPYAPIGKER